MGRAGKEERPRPTRGGGSGAAEVGPKGKSREPTGVPASQAYISGPVPPLEMGSFPVSCIPAMGETPVPAGLGAPLMQGAGGAQIARRLGPVVTIGETGARFAKPREGA